MRDQNVQKKKKRIFGMSVLFLMMILALATTVMAASGRWVADGSYSLVIQKQFDTDTSKIPKEELDKVLEEAKKKTYRFHIEGYRLDGNRNEIPIDEIIEIGPDSENWSGSGTETVVDPWKQSATLRSDGPIHVSVTEITNEVTLEVDGKEYNMGDSRAETTTLFTEAPQVRDLNSNGKITLSRPAEKTIFENGVKKTVPVTTTSFFRIHSEWPWNNIQKPAGWTEYNETVKLEPGEAAHNMTNLKPGRYTIEDLSVSGYRIQLGSRKETVSEGEEGTFYINSKPGKLKITAGGTVGDGGIHYYRVERIWAPGDAEAFVDRYTDPVESRGIYTLENLPRGQYKVTEYESSAPAEFKVRVAETKEESGGATYYKRYFGTSSAGFTKFPAGGDYITDLMFGPLRNEKNNIIKSSYSYKFAYRYKSAEDGQNKYSTTGVFTLPANKSYSDGKRPIIYPRDDGTLAFAVWNVTATTGDHVDLSWIEHTRVENEYTKSKANENYTVHVDERGWIEITAPKDQSAVPGAGNIQYTYTLRKEENGPAVRTLTLAPGATEKIEGLEAGSYLLMETVSKTKAAGFEIEISGDPFGSTVAGHSFDLTVMDERQLTIIKPAFEEGKNDGGRTYTFTVERIGGEELETPFKIEPVTLHAGEDTSNLPPIILPAGQYRVTPTDDKTEVFELTCSDSSQVHAEVPSEQASAVTFTNKFVEGNMGYRYVHEYYLLKDGKYIYEGNSPVTTVGGRNKEDETYHSIDVTKEPDYKLGEQIYTYVYMPDKNAYGYVDSPAKGKILEPEEDETIEPEDAEVLEPEENETLELEGGEVPKPEGNETIEPEDGEVLKSEENEALEPEDGEAPKPEENKTIEPEDGESPKSEENETLESVENIASESARDVALQSGENEMLQPEGDEEPKPEENETLEPDDDEEPKPEENETLEPEGDEDPESEENELQQPAKNMALMVESDIVPQAENDATVDSEGLWLRNQSTARKDDTPIVYHVDKELTQARQIHVTKNKSQIIILRYFRVLPEDQQGSYNYVHVYYQRTPNGEVWEGTSDIKQVPGQLGAPYSIKNVTQEPDYQPKGATEKFHYTFNERPSYGTLTDDHTAPHIELYPRDKNDPNHRHYNPNSDADHIVATKDGKEIIILRYYRDIVGSTEKAGAYKVVHEYYFREKLENQDTGDDSEDTGGGDEGETDAQSENGIALQAEDEGEAADTSSFSGTLSSDSQYAYTFEGARAVETLSAPLGSPHKDTEVKKQGSWRPENSQTQYPYAYKDAVYGSAGVDGRYNYVSNMEWAASTEEGDEIIILRYIRGDGVEIPETPEEPDPPGGGGGGGGGHDPDPTPPPVEPEIPEEPELPTELPDPNDPNSPDRITILENGVPRTYVKVWDPDILQWIYIPEEEVPMWGSVPGTGDESGLGFLVVLAVGSMCGLAWLNFTPQKKKD